MKVIDLYNDIVEKKTLPNKIKISGYDFIFTLREDCTSYKWYGEEKTHDNFNEVIHQNLEFVLNSNIEIIEEDKPFKLYSDFSSTQNGMTKKDRELLDNNFRGIDIILKEMLDNRTIEEDKPSIECLKDYMTFSDLIDLDRDHLISDYHETKRKLNEIIRHINKKDKGSDE